MRRGIGAGLLVLSLAVFSACGDDSGDAAGGSSDQKDTSPIVIGAAVAMTGLMQAYDEAPTNALDVAVDQMNAAGGIDGRKIELKVQDTASDLAKAKTVAQDLLEQGADIVVVSCDYDYGVPAAQVAQQQGKISFSLCAQSLKFGVQGVGPLAYTPSNSANSEGVVAAEWALKKGWDTAFVLNDPTTAYSEETCTSFVDRYKEKGGKVVGEDTFKNDDASIASQINRIKQTNPTPKMIRLCSYVPGAGTALRQIRAAGLDQPVLGNASMDGSYWLDAVPNLRDFYYPAHASIYGDDPDPKINEFLQSYEEKVGSPAANAYVLFGPTLLQLYAEGVKKAGTTDAQKVADAMNQFKDVPTLVGPTTYTDQVHIALDRPFAMIEVDDAKPKFIEDFEASEPAEFKLK